VTRKPFIIGIKNYVFNEYRGTKVEHVIMGGDLNCIDDLDLDKKGGTRHTPCLIGKQEVEKLSSDLDLGLVDGFRYLHPNKRAYTHYNKGCKVSTRLDRFLVSGSLVQRLESSKIKVCAHSDHSYVSITLGLQPIKKGKRLLL